MEKPSVFARNRETAPAILALVVALCSAVDGRGQSAQCAGIPGQPGDASLQLTLKNGQSVFQEGEIIALTAEYKADFSSKYLMNNRSYDRSGRLSGEEVFCLEPERGVDPLEDYFNSGIGFIGGGLFSDQDPGSNPLTVDLELNEWQSLPPGSYRLTIVGNRLVPGKEADAKTWQNPVIPLRSNTVDFQVEPASPGWQASQLSSAISVLDSPSATDEQKKHAARVLRFLGSEAGTCELAHRYSPGQEPFEWDFKFGLYGSPHRAVAIRAMKAELADPHHPVTREYVSTLVTLEMQSDPKLRLSPYEPGHQEEWRRAHETYQAEFERRANQYLQQASSTPRDSAAAAVTASEMLQAQMPLSPEAKERWRQVLLSNWAALPIEKQNELIEYRWAEVGGPEWLPLLNQIVVGPPNPRHVLNKPNREVALLRIYQVSPKEAAPLMLEEIAHPQGDIGINVLRHLPQRELPQYEAAWLAKIKQGEAADLVFQLVERYASSRALPEVTSIYEARRGEWACIPQTAMLRYFLRVIPGYGVKEVSAALALRNNTGCYRMQLSNLQEYIRMPQLEKLAIATLDDPEADVERDAAQALQHYGSPAAEKALWTRLEKFHDQWKDKPDELLHPRPDMIIFDSDSGLEQALVQSISNGQSWFAEAAAIRRLKELSSPAMQPALDQTLQMMETTDFALSLNWWPQNELSFTVGWYTGNGMSAFKQKLAQFPPGSHFRLITTKAEQETHQSEFAEIERAASANGQVIETLAGR